MAYPIVHRSRRYRKTGVGGAHKKEKLGIANVCLTQTLLLPNIEILLLKSYNTDMCFTKEEDKQFI